MAGLRINTTRLHKVPSVEEDRVAETHAKERIPKQYKLIAYTNPYLGKKHYISFFVAISESDDIIGAQAVFGMSAAM